MAPLGAVSAFGGYDFGHGRPAGGFSVSYKRCWLGPLVALIACAWVAKRFVFPCLRVDQAKADVWQMGVANDLVALGICGNVPGAEFADGSDIAGWEMNFEEAAMPANDDYAVG